MKALSKMTFPDSDWVVEGLLRTARKRPSLLVAKPETGKSTLARQLAVAVSQGKPFLGRDTKRGGVIYWQTEDQPQDVIASGIRLGYQPEQDEQIYVFQGDPDSSSCEDLANLLDKDLTVRLVIIETLDDLLRISDVKENSAAREAFDKFNTQLMSKFANTTVFLALHHLKKAENEFAGDAIFGASVIRGRTDSKIFLHQAGPDDERRIIHTSKRIGIAIPKTYLVFDSKTGKSELGETVSEAAHTAKTTEGKLAQEKLFNVLISRPNIEHGDLLDALDGKQMRKLKLIRDHLASGSITSSGRGVKGSPRTYQIAGVPMETNGWAEVPTEGTNASL
jgi:AAA domain